MGMGCQKFRHNVCRAITAVLYGQSHLVGGIGHGGAVLLPFKAHTQGHGVDVKTGSTEFVLCFAQAHGHTQQQFSAPKAAAKGAARQCHKAGQHACTRIFCQNFKSLRSSCINLDADHGAATLRSAAGLIYRFYRRRKHRFPVGGVNGAGGRTGIGCLPAAKTVLRCQQAVHKGLTTQMAQGVLQ